MADQKDGNSDNSQDETKKKLHWLEIGYFSSQIVLAGIGIFALFIYYGQLTEMKHTNELTQQALSGSDKTLQATLTKMQDQTDAMNRLAAEAVKQTADSQNRFRTDERAWVEIDRIEKTDTIPPDPPFSTIFRFNFFFKNFGKTVATQVRVRVDNIEGSPTFMSNEKEIRMYQDRLWRDAATGKRIKMPDKPGPQTIAPGATSHPISSVGQEPVHHGNDFRYSYILGRVDFVDAFDTDHWMKFCFIVQNNKGELGNCQYGNYEDHNPEKSQPH
jgi:hypothetical protein